MVRATGSNQDGRTSGITVPNPDAQEALAERVIARSPAWTRREVGYVEAHGTGTAVGDPLEMAALGRRVRRRRRARGHRSSSAR